MQQSYTTMLWNGPLSILAGVVAFIPFVSNWIVFAVAMYGIVLAIFAIMGTHRLNGGKASAVVLIPTVLLFILIVCGIVIAAIFWECTVNFC